MKKILNGAAIVAGLSLLGGEPFEPEDCRIKGPGKEKNFFPENAGYH